MKCITCDKDFVPERSTAKYCSDACRKAKSRGAIKADVIPKVAKKRIEKEKATPKEVDDTRDYVNGLLKKLGLNPLPPKNKPIEWISSGVPELDELIRANNTTAFPGGGFPRGKVVEIYGRKGVGKTTAMAKLLPQLNGHILYIDAENAINDALLPNVTVVAESILEEVEELVNGAVDADKFDVIIIDSVAALSPRQELEGDAGDANMGKKAMLMHQWIRRLNPYLSRSKTAVVFVNQERVGFGMFATKFTPGGTALPYAASIRVELTSYSKDRIISKGVETGRWINIKLEKNRFGAEKVTTKFKATYEKPHALDASDFDENGELINKDNIDKF